MLISEKYNLVKAYKATDILFDGWFSKNKITKESVFEYFPNAVSFKPDELLAGMVWMYHNFPLDILIKEDSRIKGERIFSKGNLVYVNCFLEKADYSVDQRKKIISSLLCGNTSKVAKNIEVVSKEINDIIENGGAVGDTSKYIAKTYENHPFNDARILKMIEKRRYQISSDRDLVQLLKVWVVDFKDKQDAKDEEKTEKYNQKIVEEMIRNDDNAKTHEKIKEEILKSKMTNLPEYKEEKTVDFEPYDANLWFV